MHTPEITGRVGCSPRSRGEDVKLTRSGLSRGMPFTLFHFEVLSRGRAVMLCCMLLAPGYQNLHMNPLAIL